MGRAKAQVLYFPQKKTIWNEFEDSSYIDEELMEFGLRAFFPVAKPSRGLFIVEGRADSEQVEENLQSVSISLYSKEHFSGIEQEIEDVSSMTETLHPEFKGYTTLYIATESDLTSKYRSYLQSKSLTDRIKVAYPHLKIFYLQWDKKEGSLGDILKAKSMKECVRKIKKEDLEKEMEKGMGELMTKYQVSSPYNLHPILLQTIKL